MRKFWATLEFKELNEEWRARLEESGFKDLESPKSHLKQHNRRTIAFDNRDALQNFYTKFEHYLTHQAQTIPGKYMQVLSLYVNGVKVKGEGGIAEQTGFTPRSCFLIIKKYKVVILKT